MNNSLKLLAVFLASISCSWSQPSVQGTAAFSATGGSIGSLSTSGCVTGVTYTSTGHYTVSLSGCATGYLPLFSSGDIVNVPLLIVNPPSSYTSSGFGLVSYGNGGGIYYDPALVFVTIIGGGGSGPTPAVFPMPNAAVFESPGACSDGTSSTACFNSGWYLKFKVTGTTSLLANVDTTVNNGSSSGQMPTLKTVVTSPGNPDSLYATVQLPANNTASTPVTLMSGLSPGTTYQVTVYGIGPDGTQSGCYSGTICETVLNSFQGDNGATISAASLRSKRCVFYGDSYLQASFGTGNPDFTWSWPFFASAAAGCEFSVFGVGTQGYVRPGNGGYPALGGSWNNYRSGLARTFSGIDYVFNCEGLNDHGESGVAAAVTSLIGAQRTGFGAAKIFFVLPINPAPLGSSVASDITSGVAAAGDSSTYVVSPPAEFSNVVFSGSTPATWCSVDGLHLNGGSRSALDGNCQGIIGYSVAMAIGAH